MHALSLLVRVMALYFACSTVGQFALAQQTEPLGMVPLFQHNPTSPADLASQTRYFATADGTAVLDASTSVLQDMGYRIKGGERELGLVFGDKVAETPGAGPGHAVVEAVLVTLSIIASVYVGQDLIMQLPEQIAQTVYVSLLVTREPPEQPVSVRVRLSIDRDMIYDSGLTKADHTELPMVYQEFFEKLSKSVFLEAELI